MSRIGKTPIDLPSGVVLDQQNGTVTLKGPKGAVSFSMPKNFHIKINENQIELKSQKDDPKFKSQHGLFRSLIANAVIGVSKGWQKTVELVGVGYRAAGGGTEVTLYVGYSHPVKISAPKDTTFEVSDNTKIIVSGLDKKVVGELAAKIRSIKPPEPYKGKGIRYLGEYVRKKAGKAVKAVGTA